ncbi:helix-turn-helix transcriptional regulator [Pontivivens ytuae]|uniref:YafY family transcriptional regulator n=1 Tax=Pontivivens ytuae TaxID=2789856 RepID=A0A7S9LTA3_9RHOB|nr:YafY family protein [Pontivivens ytuae]QPH54808.1 YafY family transcriptional regulator [Pontivivens ytuae]
MRRTDRLFEILQLFRGGKLVLGREIAERLEVSLRTVYRDIDTLIASGIPIEGERGVGYILREPLFLPPLALTLEELRALNLGVEMLRQTSDRELTEAADRLLDKINAVAPSRMRELDALREISVYAARVVVATPLLSRLRSAIERREVVDIAYESLSGERSRRTIWPLQTEFWGRVWTCASWCELRGAFRVFRVDRIGTCTPTGRTYPDEEGRRYADYLAGLDLSKWTALPRSITTGHGS